MPNILVLTQNIVMSVAIHALTDAEACAAIAIEIM
jgi:hypothetical protein